jgi:phosphate transport system substrate-binding protein
MISGCDSSSNSNSKSSSTAIDSSPKVGTSLAGSLVVEGSSTVEPIAIRAKEQFNEQHPQVAISISGKGTGNGFAALIKGEADIASASRPIKHEEFLNAQAAKVSYYELPVAYDGLTFVVNRSNDFVEQLTLEQLKKIFSEGQAVTNWNEIDSGWPAQPITIYAPGIASGSHDYFVEMIGQGMRSDERTTLSEDDKLLVRGVKEDKYSIGFFGYPYYLAEKDSLKVVKIVDKKGAAIEPTYETILAGTYPFSRPLFFYVSENSYQRMEVSEFVGQYFENAAEVVKQAGFIPLPDEIYLQCIDRLEAGKKGTGTHYLDANGATRSGILSVIYQVENLKRE